MMNKNNNRNDNGVPILISLFTAVLHYNYNCDERPPPDDVVLPAFIRNSNLGGIENK